MNWKKWLSERCPSDWTDEQALKFISVAHPNLTLDEVIKQRYN